MNIFKKLFSKSKKKSEEPKDSFPVIKDDYILGLYCIKPKQDTLVLHMIYNNSLAPITHILIFKSKNNNYYRLTFEQNILKSYELYNKSDDFSLSDLKDAYSYMRNNIEDYPDKYKMIKDDLKSILIYTLY